MANVPEVEPSFTFKGICHESIPPGLSVSKATALTSAPTASPEAL